VETCHGADIVRSSKFQVQSSKLKVNSQSFKNFKHSRLKKKVTFAAVKINSNKSKQRKNEETFHYDGSCMLSDVHCLQQQQTC